MKTKIPSNSWWITTSGPSSMFLVSRATAHNVHGRIRTGYRRGPVQRTPVVIERNAFLANHTMI